MLHCRLSELGTRDPLSPISDRGVTTGCYSTNVAGNILGDFRGGQNGEESIKIPQLLSSTSCVKKKDTFTF